MENNQKICIKCDEPVEKHASDCHSWDNYMRREGYKFYEEVYKVEDTYGIAEIGDAWDRFTSVYEGQDLNNLSFDQFWEFVTNPECGKIQKA